MKGLCSAAIRFGDLASSTASRGYDVVVSDALIEAVHGTKFPSGERLLVPRGEAAKGIETLTSIYRSFVRLGVGRASRVLAIGGGSVTDVAGFASATWMRGVAFSFAPTTLLAMIDASIGGKNGIDFDGKKNMVGTYAAPDEIFIDLAFLDSLPERDFNSAMGEAVKYALIDGARYSDAFDRIPNAARDARKERCAIEDLVHRSIELKLSVVGRDPRDDGERKILNLGHTIGHAVEAVCGITHGEAVSVGLAAVCRFAARRYGFDDGGHTERRLRSWGLPIRLGDAFALADSLPSRDETALREEIVAAMRVDKKRAGDCVSMAIPHAPGDVRVESVPFEELARFAMEDR
jgi:3-dehydroquinate synthase